ncbi:hypothetical protein [Bacillus sp. JJ1773]|uniref:hypothetical protein n=1 Tax=Bacillus sp. JJ1773 TaxID=3122965 RepID=UPI003F6898DF
MREVSFFSEKIIFTLLCVRVPDVHRRTNLPNMIAIKMDLEGVAEMCCIAGVGGDVLKRLGDKGLEI